MADEQDGGARAAEVLLEPARGLEVEMVGRLVEQQDVGRRDELLDQAESTPFATAQLRQPACAPRRDRSPGHGARRRCGRRACSRPPARSARGRGRSARASAGCTGRPPRRARRLLRQRALQREEVGERARRRFPHRRGPAKSRCCSIRVAKPPRRATVPALGSVSPVRSGRASSSRCRCGRRCPPLASSDRKRDVPE